MSKPIDQITTADFLTAEEIKQVRDGYGYMVDNGYSQIDGIGGVLRSLAVHIERARRELNYVTRHQFPSLVADAECHIRGDEAMLRNWAARAGVV